MFFQTIKQFNWHRFNHFMTKTMRNYKNYNTVQKGSLKRTPLNRRCKTNGSS
jgi:hypothetical protein